MDFFYIGEINEDDQQQFSVELVAEQVESDSEFGEELFDIQKGFEEVERVLVVGKVRKEQQQTCLEPLVHDVDFVVHIVQQIENFHHQVVVPFHNPKTCVVLYYHAKNA